MGGTVAGSFLEGFGWALGAFAAGLLIVVGISIATGRPVSLEGIGRT